jgi:hypothetical protein
MCTHVLEATVSHGYSPSPLQHIVETVHLQALNPVATSCLHFGGLDPKHA